VTFKVHTQKKSDASLIYCITLKYYYYAPNGVDTSAENSYVQASSVYLVTNYMHVTN